MHVYHVCILFVSCRRYVAVAGRKLSVCSHIGKHKMMLKCNKLVFARFGMIKMHGSLLSVAVDLHLNILHKNIPTLCKK